MLPGVHWYSGTISRPRVAFTRHSSFLFLLRMSKQCRQPVQGRMSSSRPSRTLLGSSGSASRRRVMPTKSRLPLRRYSSPISGSSRQAVHTGMVTPLRLTASTSGTVAPSALPAPVEVGGQVVGRLGIEDAVGLHAALPGGRSARPGVDAVGHRGHELGHLGALFEGGGQRVVVLHHVHEHVHGEGGTAAPLGLGHDVAQEAGAVLVALRPVLVVALVPDAREEGVALVAGAVVDLAGVEAGLVGALGGRGPQIDLVLDLLLGHGPAGQKIGAGQLLLRSWPRRT